MYLKSLCVLGALVLGLAATAAPAKATEYGAIRIENPTNIDVHYQFKWGNGEWKSYTVPSGSSMLHYHPLDSRRCTPSPYIRFDYILGDGQVTFKTYHLETYAAFDPEQGKPYAFSISDDGVLLDLYAE
jgi:hypothetical protein